MSERLGASCEVWFAGPFYPLPGDPITGTLPDSAAPNLVMQAFEKRQILMEVAGLIEPVRPQSNPCRVAFPLTTAQDLLAVLLVSRVPGFSAAEFEFLEGFCAHSAVALQVTRQSVIKNWRFEQLALVRSVSQQIQNQRDLDALCRQITRLIRETFDIYFVSIFTVHSNSGAIRFRASSGASDSTGAEVQFTVEPGQGIIGAVAQTGKEIAVSNVQQDPRFRPIDALPETQSEVALPIKLGERILGVLDLQSNQRQVIHEYDLMVLRALADNIATAIEGARLLEGLEKRAGQISAVLEISHALTSILDFEKLIEEVVHSIQRHFGYPFVHIFLTHTGRRKLFYEAGSGARSQVLQERKLAYDLDDPHGIIPHVARSGKTLLANDVSREPLYRPSDLPPENTGAELAIPLVFGGQVLGVLDLQSDQPDSFDPADIPLLEALGSSIAIAIRNATLYRSEIWRRKVTDSFREIAGLVSANVALDELLDQILTELENTLPCEVSAIWLVDESEEWSNGSQKLKLAAVHGASPEAVKAGIDDPGAKGLMQLAMDSTEPTLRTAEDPIGPLGLAMNYPPDYSSVAAPLRAGERVLGILAIAHPSPGRYGSDAGMVALTLANNAAIAIQNNQLFAAAQEQAWVSTVLLQIAGATQSNLSVEELFTTMARLTPLLIGVKKCAFFLWDTQTQQFMLISHYGLSFDGETPIDFNPTLPAFQRLVETAEVVFIENPQSELELPQADLADEHGTLVLLPLLSRGNLLGAYLVGHQVEGDLQANNEFDQQTLSLLQGIAQQTAVALENLQLLEARQEEAYVTAVLLQVAQAVVSQNELKDILDTIVHLLTILVGIDACAIYLWNPKEGYFQTAEVYAASSKDAVTLKNKTFTPEEFPLLQAAMERDTMLACQLDTPDLSIQRWPELTCFTPAHDFNWRESRTANWILGVPLSLKGEVYGVMVASETNVPTAFHERRLEILTGVAQQVSLAIQNDRLNREMVERERLEKEMQLARQIQRTFLPTRLPQVPGWEIAVSWQTARQVGGDLYDIFRLGKDRIGLVIADVSDKGIPAALYMTVVRTLIRAFVHNTASPSRILERVNKLLVGDTQDGLYVTAVYAVLDTQTGLLTYANAGHNLPLLIRRNHRTVEPLPRGGMALGILSDSKLEDRTVDIHPGDSLLFYTDGVTESFSPSGEIFGEERLVKALETAPGSRVDDLNIHLSRVLTDFLEGDLPSDDLTLIFLHRCLVD
jgi:GAF domain-containing protein